MIEARWLHKRFGSIDALDGVTFVAPDACITGLLGPNGAGKSTTLRILYATLAADSGTACVDGDVVSVTSTEVRKRIGVLPHNAGLYPALTARENIEYFGRLCGLDRSAARARTGELIELLDLQDIASRRAKGFSQGQKIRTALARALVHSPRNLILDEPTNGLDVPAVRKLRALLLRLRELGHCILFSSHVMHEVAMLCDEAVVISAGRVVACGTPEALRQRTQAASFEDAFVALTGDAGENA
ncbi:MAG TPA: ATP-binding cassette domain-containing protein [Steroidobacteraceae bacterium]|nr:ATP-binding cassette domain-containing protein [Steroidobacteraceae bacterium]